MTLTRRYFSGLALSALGLSLFNVSSAYAGARIGRFKGLNNHVVKGAVKVEKKGKQQFVFLSKDFFFDGAPDPKIGFGRKGKYVKGTTIHSILPKKQWKGASKHAVPANIDVDKYTEVYIWCEQFSVPLGVARIK